MRGLAAVMAVGLVVLGRWDGAAAQTEPTPISPEPSPSPTAEPPPPSPPPASTAPGDHVSDQGGQTGATEIDGTWVTTDGPSQAGPGGTTDPFQRPRRWRNERGCAALSGSAPYLGPPGDTRQLFSILARVRRFGFSLERAMLRVGGPFPVSGPASWSNDWHAIRCEPYPHLHEGIDIFAPYGTPVVATVDGRVTQVRSAAIAGLSVEVSDGRATQYFYAHLSGFADGIAVGQHVTMGDVLGYIGNTGNARGSPSHLHLEVQPGGTPVPPKPYVDRWLRVSERKARSWVASLARGDGWPMGARAPIRPAATGSGRLPGALGWTVLAVFDARRTPLERWPILLGAPFALAVALRVRWLLRDRARRASGSLIGRLGGRGLSPADPTSPMTRLAMERVSGPRMA